MASSTTQSPGKTMEDLEEDPRWQLVQRIADSAVLARAKQLREFLLYSSRWALNHPGVPLSEAEIAQNVMGRRADFHATHDNIVRVQASHLRHKLEIFFATEGLDEAMTVAFPKGIYTPVFTQAKSKEAFEPKGSESHSSAPFSRPESAPLGRSWITFAGKPWISVGVLACLCVALGIYIVTLQNRLKAVVAPNPETKSILKPLIRNGKPIAIILPDLGFSAVQSLLHTDVEAQEYASGLFPENTLQKLDDPKLKEALQYISVRRAVSYSEFNGVLELVNELHNNGSTPVVQFARDIHVRDLGVGNTILIGSSRSNPWVSIFAERTNFRFVSDRHEPDFYFENRKPQNNEQLRYVPMNTPHGRDGYVDVVVLSNPTSGGYTLLIDGSDADVNESAIHYLLSGNLPRPILDGLTTPGTQYLEIFLRGTHLTNEAVSDIQVVGFRSSSSK